MKRADLARMLREFKAVSHVCLLVFHDLLTGSQNKAELIGLVEGVGTRLDGFEDSFKSFVNQAKAHMASMSAQDSPTKKRSGRKRRTFSRKDLGPKSNTIMVCVNA